MNTAQHRLETLYRLLQIMVIDGDSAMMRDYRTEIKGFVVNEDLIIPLVALLAAVSEIDEEDLDPNVREALRAFQKAG